MDSNTTENRKSAMDAGSGRKSTSALGSMFCNPHGDCYKVGITIHPVKAHNPVIGWAVMKRERNSDAWNPIDGVIRKTKPEAVEDLKRVRGREREIWHF